MKKQHLIPLFTLAALAALLAFFWAGPGGLQKAPPLKVNLLNGQGFSLQAQQGKPVLVNFWATTCPGCIAEMPHLVELYDELAPQGFTMIALAMDYDPEAQVREMVRQKNLPYPVAMDSDGSIAKAFGEVKLTPTTFLIDPQGRIVQQTLGELDMKALRLRIKAMLEKKA